MEERVLQHESILDYIEHVLFYNNIGYNRHDLYHKGCDISLDDDLGLEVKVWLDYRPSYKELK